MIMDMDSRPRNGKPPEYIFTGESRLVTDGKNWHILFLSSGKLTITKARGAKHSDVGTVGTGGIGGDASNGRGGRAGKGGQIVESSDLELTEGTFTITIPAPSYVITKTRIVGSGVDVSAANGAGNTGAGFLGRRPWNDPGLPICGRDGKTGQFTDGGPIDGYPGANGTGNAGDGGNWSSGGVTGSGGAGGTGLVIIRNHRKEETA